MHVPAILSFLLVLLISIKSVRGIKCYDCDSLHDPRCNEYFCGKGVQEVECDESLMPDYLKQFGIRIEPTGCITKIHEGVGGQQFFVRRSCYFGDLENTKPACEAEDPYVPYAEILDCHVCTEDLCNTDTAPKGKASLYTIIAFCVALILARF